MKNEWDLFLLVRARLGSGEAEVSFDILKPALWTIFSGRPALVRGADGEQYELSPDFPTVLHELVRAAISSGLIYALPDEYRLYFWAGRDHAQHRPVAPPPPSAALTIAVAPETLRQLLDELPPGAFPLPHRPADETGGRPAAE